jgi:hypothetical protein
MSQRGIDSSGVRVYRKRLYSFLIALLLALVALIFLGALFSGKAPGSPSGRILFAVTAVFSAGASLMFLVDFLRLRPLIVIDWKGVVLNMSAISATRAIPWSEITKVGKTTVRSGPRDADGIELTLRNIKELVEAWSSASTGLGRVYRRLLLRPGLSGVWVSETSVSFPTKWFTHSREELLELLEEGMARYGPG